MRFHLSFEGSLPSTGNHDPNNPRPAKLKAIWAIRDYVHVQLEQLFKTHPALSGRSGASRVLRHALIPPIRVDDHRFFALARSNFNLKCGLKVDLLVNHQPGSVLSKQGDLDNRLKTLFDGLRVPTVTQEIKQFKTREQLEADDYICLLQDDVLITSLQIEVQRYLGAPLNVGEDHVRANIAVLTEPSEAAYVNEAFQID
jgi:hypothetical protein